MSFRVRRLTIALVVAIAGLAPATMASATPGENGCNGLYEVARFATFKNVGDTNGHATVHHQFEVRGCGHHH